MRPHSCWAAAEGHGRFRHAAAAPFVSLASPASQPSQPSQPSPFCGGRPNTAPATQIGLWSLLAATMARSACFDGLRVAWVYGRGYSPAQNRVPRHYKVFHKAHSVHKCCGLMSPVGSTAQRPLPAAPVKHRRRLAPPLNSRGRSHSFAPATAGASLVLSTKIQHSRTKRTGTAADPGQSWPYCYHMYIYILFEVTVG